MKGRKQVSYTHEQRLAYLKEFDESGKSLRKYCEGKDINYWTISDWIRKRSQKTYMFSEQTEESCFIQIGLRKSQKTILEYPQDEAVSQPLALQRGAWRLEIPLNANYVQLEKVITILEAVHGL